MRRENDYRSKFSLAVVLLSVLAGLCSGTVSGAAESSVSAQKFKQAVGYYEQGQYARAIELLQAVLLAEPANAQAHYYYGNCLAQDGQYSAANFEYRAGYQYSPASSNLRKYCLAGINNTAGRSTRRVENDKAASSEAVGDKTAVKTDDKTSVSGGNLTNKDKANGDTASGAAGKGGAAAAVKAALPTRHLDQHFDQVRSELEQERLSKIAVKQKELDRFVSGLQAQMREDIYLVPRTMFASGEYPNPEYNNTVQRIRRDAEEKIKIRKIDFEDEFRKINDFYAAKLEVLLGSHRNLKTQIGATAGASQVVPSNTNMYLRNYVNFGGTDEAPIVRPAAEPLMAVPGSLHKGRPPLPKTLPK
jgi:tetratricopeptide (TPR) repeat protein